MEWNAENVLDALNEFERKAEISPILNDYLKRIAKNGEIVFPWCKLKPLLKKKLDIVLDEFYETCPVETSAPVPNFEAFNFETLKKTILSSVEAFTSAPFTIQRLCELVTDPQKHYNRTDKYMRGIEKNVLVVSTVEPRLESPETGNNNNNPVVNGMPNELRDDIDAVNGHDDSVSSTNMNSPSNHVLLENFANVFPSAACIPSPTNTWVDRNEFMKQLNKDMHQDLEAELMLDINPELKEKLQAELKEDMDLKDDSAEMDVNSTDDTKKETSSEEPVDIVTDVEQDSTDMELISKADSDNDTSTNFNVKPENQEVSSNEQNEKDEESVEHSEPMDTTDDTEAEAFIMSETCSRVYKSHSVEIKTVETSEETDVDANVELIGDVLKSDVIDQSDVSVSESSAAKNVEVSCEQDGAVSQSDDFKCSDDVMEKVEVVSKDQIAVDNLEECESVIKDCPEVSQSLDEHVELSEQVTKNEVAQNAEDSAD